MKDCAAFLTVDMIFHYLIKAVICVIFFVCILHTAFGAGMFAVSPHQISLFHHLSLSLLWLYRFTIFALSSRLNRYISESFLTRMRLISNCSLYLLYFSHLLWQCCCLSLHSLQGERTVADTTIQSPVFQKLFMKSSYFFISVLELSFLSP